MLFWSLFIKSRHAQQVCRSKDCGRIPIDRLEVFFSFDYSSQKTLLLHSTIKMTKEPSEVILFVLIHSDNIKSLFNNAHKTTRALLELIGSFENVIHIKPNIELHAVIETKHQHVSWCK